MNNDCIRGYIFNSKVPLSCPRFSDFMGDGLCLLDSGVYIEFWHDRAVNHGSWWSRRPSAYNEEAILIEANEKSGGLIHSLDSLVRFKPYRERLLRAAGKYYWGNSFVLSDELSSKDYSSMIRRAGSKKALDDIEKVIKADKYLSSSEKKVLIENIEIGRKFVKDMKFHDSEYTVAYVRNGVNQIIGVRANSEEEAKQKFLAYAQRKGGGYEFVGVSYGFESKPGFPVIDGAMMDAQLSGRWVWLKYSEVAGKSLKAAITQKYRDNYREDVSISRLEKRYSQSKGELEIQVFASSQYLAEEGLAGFWAAVQCTAEQASTLRDSASVGDGDSSGDGDSEVIGSADPKQDAAYDYGGYKINGETYRGFEITSSDGGLRKGFYRFYSGSTPDTVFFGNSAVDGSFRKGDFMRLVEAGKIKLLDSERVISVGRQFKNSSDSVLEITGVDGDMVSFSVYGGSKSSPKMSRTLDSNAFDTLIKISGYHLVDADPDLDETHAFDDTVYAPIVDADYVNGMLMVRSGQRVSYEELKTAAMSGKLNIVNANFAEGYGYINGRERRVLENIISKHPPKASQGSNLRVGQKVMTDLPHISGLGFRAVITGISGDKYEIKVTGATAEKQEIGRTYKVKRSDIYKVFDAASEEVLKMFKVKDKKSGRVLLVKATDSVGALCKLRDALNFGVLAELLNKALDAATGKTISASGAYATARGNSVSVDVASSADVPAVKAIVESVISANADARASLKIRTSSHEVVVDRSTF